MMMTNLQKARTPPSLLKDDGDGDGDGAGNCDDDDDDNDDDVDDDGDDDYDDKPAEGKTSALSAECFALLNRVRQWAVPDSSHDDDEDNEDNEDDEDDDDEGDTAE